MSYATKRTLILRSKGWRYNPQGWETVFKPVSNSCTVDTGGSREPYPGSADTVNLELPIIDSVNPRPKEVPLAVPKDLVPRVHNLHGNPALWWISQLVAFLQRPQKNTEDFLNQLKSKFALEKPYVGVHVRRTDKIGTEASFHGIEEYMAWVEEYFDKHELKNGKLNVRRVYVASDDPKVLEDARNRYPDYKFFGDPEVASTAAVQSRYTSASLRGVISDIHMLAESDYVVCTLSSQVCRVAFEMMQLRFPDASERCKSLDDIFYFGGQKAHNQIALYDHSNPGPAEIAFKKGDILGIAGNHWDGYSKGINRRTKDEGLFPSYKATELVDAVDFGAF